MRWQFYLISLFGLNEYLKGNAKNIICLLLRIATFIKQHKLKDKTTDDIPQISKFGFVIWEFLSVIYESG